MPAIPPGRRAQAGGGYEHTKLAHVWCHQCQPGTRTLVARVPANAAQAEAHAHIDRHHTMKGTQ